MSKYTSVELFAGAGDLAFGLEKIDIWGKLLVEIDKRVCQTLKKQI